MVLKGRLIVNDGRSVIVFRVDSFPCLFENVNIKRYCCYPLVLLCTIRVAFTQFLSQRSARGCSTMQGPSKDNSEITNMLC